MTTLVNLTPHEITILNKDHEVVKVIPTSGEPCPRIIPGNEELDRYVGDIPLWITKKGEIDCIPGRREDTLFVVSQVVLDWVLTHHPDRDDFVIPHKLLRNDQGQILGCLGFAQKLG